MEEGIITREEFIGQKLVGKRLFVISCQDNKDSRGRIKAIRLEENLLVVEYSNFFVRIDEHGKWKKTGSEKNLRVELPPEAKFYQATTNTFIVCPTNGPETDILIVKP